MFVDSDDWVHEDFCKLPYECAIQHKADLVMFGRYRVDKKGSYKPLQGKEKQSPGMITKIEAIDLILSNTVGAAAWDKLYKKELFNTILYPVGFFYEEIGTTHKLALLADSIYYLNKKLYYYCYHECSITELRTKKSLQDWFAMSIQRYCDLVEWGYPTDKLELLRNKLVFIYCFRKKIDKKDPNYIFCLDTLCYAHRYPDDFSWRRKIVFSLLKYCPCAFDLVCDLWGKRWKLVE